VTVIDGFWSYVHDDDDADYGRISQLARDVRAQFEMLTGESINLFLDRDQLVWGDDWRPKIDASLSSIAFFVPVITPRFFRSEECRREFNFFARSAERLGVKELVLPVLWVDFPGLHVEDPGDDLIALVRQFQWSDWTNAKFAEIGSGEYRKAVNELAERLVLANAAAESSTRVLDLDTETSDEDELGTLDKLGAMEESIPQMTEILQSAGEAIQEIGELMQAATLDLNSGTSAGNPLAVRLRVARNLATSLDDPVTRIRAFGNGFSSSLNEVDEGVRIIINRAPEEVAEHPESREQFEGFFTAIREMVKHSEEGLGAIANMAAQIAPIEKLSRDLRKPLRTLREGLTLFVDGLSVMRGWVALIDQTELPEPTSTN